MTISEQTIYEFLEDIEKVCKEHGFSISHEDSQGSFEIVYFNKEDMNWLRAAEINLLSVGDL